MYLPSALHTPCPVLYLAYACVLNCNRKYSSIQLFPALCLFKSINAKNITKKDLWCKIFLGEICINDRLQVISSHLRGTT